MKKNIKMVVTDIDNTLLRRDKTVSDIQYLYSSNCVSEGYWYRLRQQDRLQWWRIKIGNIVIDPYNEKLISPNS